MVYTTQQQLVLSRILEKSERPLTAQEILDEARKEIPHLGIATVYRALKKLQADGKMRVVEIPGTTPHYEKADRHHHHFFLCQQCQRMFNLIGCLPGINALAPNHFNVQRHEIVLYGQCAECQGAAC